MSGGGRGRWDRKRGDRSMRGMQGIGVVRIKFEREDLVGLIRACGDLMESVGELADGQRDDLSPEIHAVMTHTLETWIRLAPDVVRAMLDEDASVHFGGHVSDDPEKN